MVNRPFNLTPFQQKHSAPLREMLLESWRETYTSELGDHVTGRLLDSLTSKDIGGLVPNKDENVFVAFDEDDLIGSAVSASRHGVIYIWGFYVLKKYQRMGLGRMLLAQTLELYGPNDIVSLIVLKSSLSAIEFYKSCGFDEQEEKIIELAPNTHLPAITMTFRSF